MNYTVFSVWSFVSLANICTSKSPVFTTSYFYRLRAFNKTPETPLWSMASPAMRCLWLCLDLGDACFGWKYTESLRKCSVLTEVSDTEKPKNSEDVFLKPITCRNTNCLHGGECRNLPSPRLSSALAFLCRCRCGSCGVHCERLNFGRQKRRGIVENNIGRITAETPETCQTICLTTPACRSVDYARKDKRCYLNKVNHTEPRAKLEVFENIDYYYPVCMC
ncbi:uncharacterized protein LOC111087707 [Limulus polyphemus]|uniref:Uncharacterized protein LOC111087707 n=1 Tax=Limulus polyphemus TaxID=6850 RepID=A0ABM1T541_LIMPO|nr:uncharacterized protein LOC111087707 [Limulus polyphemus]